MTPNSAAIACLTGRHGFVSVEHPQQIALVAEVCQTFALDNGAFSHWNKTDEDVSDWTHFYEFCQEWRYHPGCDWAIIPDTIKGTEARNDELIREWPFKTFGVPVWHLHESMERLMRLAEEWPRIALGSSGQYAQIGTPQWADRMHLAMIAICDLEGRPITKLHGLRMLDPRVFTVYPFASADSTNVAMNIGIDQAWRGTYMPPNKDVRAQVIASRIESQQSAAVYDFQHATAGQFPMFELGVSA